MIGIVLFKQANFNASFDNAISDKNILQNRIPLDIRVENLDCHCF